MKNNMEKKTQVNQIYNDENALIRGVSYEKDEKFYPLRRGIEYGACSGVIYDKNFKEEQVMELTPVSVSTLTSVVVAECLNFDLFLLSRVLEIYDIEEGEQLQVFYTIKIMVYTMKGSVVEFQKKIMASKVKEFSWVTMATNAFAQIPQDKTEKLEFQRKVQQCIETEEAPTEILYPVAGWRKVPNIGWRFIFGDGIVGEKNKLVRTNSAYASMLVKRECVGSKQVFDMAMTMQRICDSGMCSTALFLYTHASMLATIFTEASHPLQFVFAISGVTNSRKTSLALEMAKVFSREKMITDAEFATATACGIEKVLGKYKDGVVIVDDFKPGVTVSQQKIMNEKLDAVVRFYGNRVSKKE